MGISPDNWIIDTADKKPDADTRRRIRSHVMRGKNTRSLKRSKKVQHSAEGAHEWLITTPRKVASEMALFGLETNLAPYQQELIHRAFTVVKPPTPAFEGMLLNQPVDNMFCFGNFSHNLALLNAILFTAQTYRDVFVDQTPPSAAARVHLAFTLQHLQTRLEEEGTSVTDTTLSVMVTLAMASVFMADVPAAETHLDGLRVLIQSRGGIQTLQQGTMLERKARRIDFGLALTSGRPLRFVPDSALMGRSAGPILSHPELDCISPAPDHRLISIWSDLKRCAADANGATNQKTKLPPSVFTDLLTSLPSQLLALEPQHDLTVPSPSEVLRLSLLAVLKSILTPFAGFGKTLTYMVTRLQTNLMVLHEEVTKRGNRGLAPLMTWAGFVAALSIFEQDVERTWLQQLVVDGAQGLGVRSWIETKECLSAFVWFDAVFDKEAQKVYNDWLK